MIFPSDHYYFLGNEAPVIAAHDESWYIDIIDRTDKSTQRVKVLSAYTPFKSLGTIQEICKKQDDQFEVQLAKTQDRSEERLSM